MKIFQWEDFNWEESVKRTVYGLANTLLLHFDCDAKEDEECRPTTGEIRGTSGIYIVMMIVIGCLGRRICEMSDKAS
jgi:hypothetical protein